MSSDTGCKARHETSCQISRTTSSEPLSIKKQHGLEWARFSWGSSQEVGSSNLPSPTGTPWSGRVRPSRSETLGRVEGNRGGTGADTSGPDHWRRSRPRRDAALEVLPPGAAPWPSSSRTTAGRASRATRGASSTTPRPRAPRTLRTARRRRARRRTAPTGTPRTGRSSCRRSRRRSSWGSPVRSRPSTHKRSKATKVTGSERPLRATPAPPGRSRRGSRPRPPAPRRGPPGGPPRRPPGRRGRSSDIVPRRVRTTARSSSTRHPSPPAVELRLRRPALDGARDADCGKHRQEVGRRRRSGAVGAGSDLYLPWGWRFRRAATPSFEAVRHWPCSRRQRRSSAESGPRLVGFLT